jgi:pilus assembly protein CpaB
MVLLLVALIAGGLAAFLATRGGSEPEQVAVTQVVQEARAQVLIAKTNVGVGERLSPENVQWQDWPEGAVRAEYITSAGTPNAIDQMKGAIARFELFPGEPIQQNKLVRSDQGYLSAVLDKGMRGVSISVSAESASGGFIVPNDHVDVILSQGGPNGAQTSSTLLSNVRVLAINTRLGETGKTGAPDGDDSDPNASPKSQVFPGTAIATVELDPVQAETIINASQLGRLSLALRSIVDFKPTAGEQDNIRRNAPIKLIRYGQEASVMAGTAAGGSDATPAGFAVPTTSVTVGPGGALD